MAEVPREFNYQGYLTDTDGVPIGLEEAAQVQMWFSLYDQEIDGTELWSEGPVTVTVTGGVFNVLLGRTVPVTPEALDGPCWLEVIADGEYFDPRQRIGSTPFAIESLSAETLGGHRPADFAEDVLEVSAKGASSIRHSRT